jgi:hypothetical protein
VLSLASVAPVKGSYRVDQGETLTVKGSLNASRSHLLNLQIAGADGDRLLHLAFHGQEDDVFSGITVWKGRNLGVSGARLTT